MNSSYKGHAHWHGGINDGEVSRRAQISILGNTAKISTYNPAKGRLEEMDILDEAVLTEGHGEVEVAGVSRQLVQETRVPKLDAKIKVRMVLAGCQTC